MCCCFRCFVVNFAAVSAIVEVTCPTDATASLNVVATVEVEFFDEIQTKVLRVFLLGIYSHLYSFPLKFLFL